VLEQKSIILKLVMDLSIQRLAKITAALYHNYPKKQCVLKKEFNSGIK